MSRQPRARAGLGALAALLVLWPPAGAAGAVAPAAAPSPPRRSPEEIVRLGERMYRDGILPSGEPMRAIVKGDIEVEGSAFSCESCHMRAGIGSVEGQVVTPPTNARRLFQPRKKYYKGVEVVYDEPSELRGVYTDESLAVLIASGVDPAGKVANDVMPSYLLEGEDMQLLVAYLHTLSPEFSPGVTDRTLNFATVVSEDVPAGQQAAAFEQIELYLAFKNALRENYRRGETARDRVMRQIMANSREVEPRTLTHSRWVLRGPRETWRAQLEAYDREQPAFALLGGVVTGEWRPIHEFSEERRIPCLFPNTDLPVVSDTDWYTMYLSKGYYQEGEAAARYLHRIAAAPRDAPILQVVRDTPEGQALAEGFEHTWRGLGHAPPATVALAGAQPLAPEALRRDGAAAPPFAALLWDGPAAAAGLETLAALAPGSRPGMVFASGSYLGEGLWTLPEPLREWVFVAYPFRPPQDKVFSMMGDEVRFPVPDNRIAKHSYSLVEVLKMTLMGIKNDYHRDYFLDVVSMGMDLTDPLYERLSFGPGQRYASKGCYVVQLSRGPRPELVKKSGWVIH